MINPQNPAASSGTGSRAFWQCFAAFFGIALLIYVPALRSGFIWDDDVYVTANTALKNLHGLWNIWFHPVNLPQYYPMTFSSFWAEYHLWGLQAAGYHTVNILLHALSSLLVWRLLQRLKIPGACLAALLFLVHPVHVESVAWITERKNVLSGFFYLAAFLAYFRFKDHEPRLRPWYFVSFALFLASLLSKTITATFPAVLLLTLGWKDGKFNAKDITRMIPFFLAAAILGFVTMRFENWHMAGMSEEWRFSSGERLLIAGRAFWFYLGKLVWPHPLIFIYPRWTLDTSSFGQWLFPLAFILLALVLWKFRTKWGRGPWFAFLIFTVTLFPALGFKSYFPMRFSFVADHFQYLASIAPLTLAAVFLHSLSLKTSRFRFAPAGILLICLAVLSWNQSRIYKDLETLWRDTLKKNPEAWMAHNNLGNLLSDRNLDDDAERHFQEVLRIKPNEAQAYANLGCLMEKQGKSEKALEYFQKAALIQPSNCTFWNNLGSTYIGLGRIQEGIAHYLKSGQLDPTYPAPYYNLGNVTMMMGDIQSAVQWYQKALVIEPENASFHISLGSALAELGQKDEAAAAFKKALEFDPGNTAAFKKLAALDSQTDSGKTSAS